MGTKPVRIEEEEKQRLEDRHDATDNERVYETATEVVEVGLRELEGPITHRVRDIALSAAYHLTLVAVVLLVTGYSTSLLTPADGLRAGFATLTVAGAPVAVVECLRIARGQSEIGAALRRDDS